MIKKANCETSDKIRNAPAQCALVGLALSRCFHVALVQHVPETQSQLSVVAACPPWMDRGQPCGPRDAGDPADRSRAAVADRLGKSIRTRARRRIRGTERSESLEVDCNTVLHPVPIAGWAEILVNLAFLRHGRRIVRPMGRLFEALGSFCHSFHDLRNMGALALVRNWP